MNGFRASNVWIAVFPRNALLREVFFRGGHVFLPVEPFDDISRKPGFGPLRIPIGFAGGLHDRDLGFVRFGWRDYDTFTDRWTAPDPLGDKGGDPDWYGYCFDDPVNGNDPLGLFAGMLAPLIQQAAEGSADFMRNYGDMEEANTIGADKYFHCKANYEASQHGPGGKAAAWGLSELQELFGQMKGDPISGKEADQRANRTGRNASHLNSCGEACDKYRPSSLDKRW
ncbi:RHS repeat-associated core domain-containing protein [Pseudodesulfovibrio sp.]|uniref:RHS repeat-associated core domain-containing protein n=1 Tax=Pseudodesulfovibrio sp. TaxID=2035812 RepID=UPI00260A4AEE|nr:RHS repeat-associated core domain-containing protein [Pseudodesulfovibrio sp.]MDD3311921.1 hypothetical protein [Pseudodesulfovibrio sp.]